MTRDDGQGVPSPFGPSMRAQYFGGPLISSAIVVGVSWTSAVDPTVQSTLPGFYSALVGTGSPLFSWLTEYSTTCAFGPPYFGGSPAPGSCSPSTGLTGGDDDEPGSNQTLGFGSFLATGSGPGGMYVISPTNTNVDLSDSDIQTELQGQISAGNLPNAALAANLDATGNTRMLYMIDFPSGYSITFYQGSMPATSCVEFCGYHNSMDYTGISVPYGVLMDQTASSACGGPGFCGPKSNTYVQNETAAHTHELVEASTDGYGQFVGERPSAWYDVGSATDMGGEIADLCNQDDQAITFPSGSTYTVQEIWSNQNSACIGVAPYCNGTSSPPSCTPCTSSSQCTGSTPDCETDSSSAFFGVCVACTSDAACGALVCNSATDTCQCTSSTQCSGATPVCGSSSTCVPCTSDEQCKGNPAGAVCDSSGSCVPCLKNSDCPKDMPICNTFSNTCTTSEDAGTDGSAPIDSGTKDSGQPTDAAGPRDAAKPGSGATTSGGCTVASARGSRSEASMLLLMVGMIGLARRRTKRQA